MTVGSRVVGVAMRLYRKSPLYPAWGARLGAVLARLPRRQNVVVREIGGVTFELDLREVIGSSLYYSGTFEADTERAISAALKPGMTAVDVGANIGYHTFRMAAAVGPTGSVLAVEPMSNAFTRLVRNAALNDFRCIEYAQVALSDADLGDQEIKFQWSYRLDGRDENATETVQVTTLDKLVAEQSLERVDFIKVDVDGYEGKVLCGAESTLREMRPVILFEISPAGMRAVGDEATDLVAFLERLGYTLTNEQGQPVADAERLLAQTGDHSINIMALP